MESLFADLSNRLEAMHKVIETSIAGLPDDALDWVPGRDMNSMAVLLAHTLGAERYWIGDVAGGEPSGRVREAEFETTGISTAEFIRRSRDVLAHSQSVLGRMSAEDLGELRVALSSGKQVTSAWAILHALEHTALHAGHLEITRQLWEQRPGKRGHS
jgi:uncharacterized damage-inducible protein DinB